MPRAATREARAQRNASMYADRARGLTVRAIAKRYGLAPSVAHRLVRHVPIVLPNHWHLARQPQEAPLPMLALVHRYRASL